MNTLSVVNPATGEILRALPVSTPDQVAYRAQAARAAQPGWAALPLARRMECIARFRDGVVRDQELLARVMTQETGKPIRMSRNELGSLASRIDFFLAQVETTTATETVFDADGMIEQISHPPLGVVANISAWNYPWFVGCNVVLPALLTGNAVLYKPSEYSTLTGVELTRLLHEAGVPQDAMTCLVGGSETGASLLAQSIDGVFFTGSHATGKHIAQQLAGRMIRLQLELGGKDPSYVCDDADLLAAAASLAEGAMYNTGQSCCAVERIYVHARIHDAFVERFVEIVSGLRRGDPTSEDTYIGAITRPQQLATLEAQVADARAKGAKLLLGGARGAGPGNWFEPTVLSKVNHSMELMREESFGPVIGIQKVASDDEAVGLMNDTRYGLTAGVYTRDAVRARHILAQLKAGSVYWNCCDRVSPRLPWGGVDDSGIGLTLSTYGIATFTRPRAWHLRVPEPVTRS
jgi:acyl-CoA reductase-like NAD-dependent aldehyde dehydrogenase